MTNSTKAVTRVLILGGTTEANTLAARLAGDARFAPVLSLAGRTANPKAAPIPMRIGGFGGVDGLKAYLVEEGIDMVIDATHPFAAVISRNAIDACRRAGRPLLAIERPQWQSQPGDCWRHFRSVEDAVSALPGETRRVFSGLGRLSLDALSAAPQHHYVIRVIDPLAQPPALPSVTIVTTRGPFKVEDDIALFQEYGVEVILAKNSGGSAAVSKIDAARALGLEVLMIDRPSMPDRPVVATVDDVLQSLARHHASPAKRGV